MGCVVNATLRPLYPRERDPVPILQEAGWPQGRHGRVRKTSSPPGFDPRTVQPVASRYTDYTIPDHIALFEIKVKCTFQMKLQYICTQWAIMYKIYNI
jgi:hypothetical protein